VRENRTHGSEGGDRASRFRPLSGEFRTGPPIKAFGDDKLGYQAQISSSVGERNLMKHFVVRTYSPLVVGVAALGRS